MSHSFSKLFFRGALLLAAFAILFPEAVKAATFPNGEVIRTPGLVFTVNNLKSTITLPTPIDDLNDNVELKWTTNEKAKGCVNNWGSSTEKSGTVKGNTMTSRPFVITCYGVGAGQTAKVTVNIVKPDVSASGLTIKGMVKKAGSEYFAYSAANPTGTSNGVLAATIKNAGKLPISGATYAFQYSTAGKGDGANWMDGAVTPTSGAIPSTLAAGKSFKATGTWQPGATSGTSYHIRVCVRVPSGVIEGNTANNCSNAVGPYSFVVKP